MSPEWNNNIEIQIIVLTFEKDISGLSQTGFIIMVKKHPPWANTHPSLIQQVLNVFNNN